MNREVVLKAENLVKHYPIKAGVLRRGLLRALQGRNTWHSWRIRVRKVKPRSVANAAGGTDRRHADL
jgi:hypothetical protein